MSTSTKLTLPHPEDEFFVIARIHVPAQDVAGFKEAAFETRKGELGRGGHTAPLYSRDLVSCRVSWVTR